MRDCLKQRDPFLNLSKKTHCLHTWIRNPLKTLDEQNVSKQAKIIIGLLFRDYWATEEQKSKIVAKQNYEREKLIKEQKNLFKYKNRNMKESEIINCEEKFLQEPKDNIFKRIFKRIKCIFKLKN